MDELPYSDPPGEHLLEELEARHWSQTEFAHILKRPTQFVSEIIAGKKEITRESATQIAAALGTSAQYWLNLQNDHLLRKQNENPHLRRGLDEVRLRARMNELAPVSLMLKRGLLYSRDLDGLRQEIQALFQVDDLFAEPAIAAAARRTSPTGQLTRLQIAWLACARRSAEERHVGRFDHDGLHELAKSLTHFATSSHAFLIFPEMFAAVGVRLVHVEAFPTSKMDGAAFLLSKRVATPVIAISGRGKRLDKVLFTLLHEIAHIVAHHVTPERSIIDDDDGRTTGEEDAANDLASAWILPGVLDAPPPFIRREWVFDQAARLRVHPLVVVGRLQYAGVLDWRSALARDGETVSDALEAWNETAAD